MHSNGNANFITSDNINNNESAITRTKPSTPSLQNQQIENMDKIEKSTFKVFLTNGNCNIVKFGDVTDVRGIITLLTSRLSSDSSKRFYEPAYGIRISNTVKNDQTNWLHPDITMNEALDEHQSLDTDWRYRSFTAFHNSYLIRYLFRIRYYFKRSHLYMIIYIYI